MAVNQNHSKTVLVKVKTLHGKGHSRAFSAKFVGKGRFKGPVHSELAAQTLFSAESADYLARTVVWEHRVQTDPCEQGTRPETPSSENNPALNSHRVEMGLFWLS